ncbi:MAG: aldo/keto reductase [Actinomycetia bacterium]|jgi:aryl-alcohol dehydrogenase-like predicted oxidoreductase|nr:aldo/keto reductase [Actinomycetes bacterium]
MSSMPTRRIGRTDVGAIGLGAMLLSIAGRPGEAQAIRTVHAALDAGVTLIDTADAYCLGGDEAGHNERLIRKALDAWPGDRDRVLVATKGGHTRPGREWGLDGRPEYLRKACEASLAALGVEVIGLYQFHRPDPKVPFLESVGALAELKAAGKVRMVGLSNVSVDQIRQAREVVEVASVQNEFSPRFRRSEGELAFCAANRIAFLPWSPLGGIGRGRDLGGRHRAFAEVAEAHGVSPQRVALAWELAKAPVVIPIPGARRPETITDSAAATSLRLSADELARLDSY